MPPGVGGEKGLIPGMSNVPKPSRFCNILGGSTTRAVPGTPPTSTPESTLSSTPPAPA